jgi:transposase-like protein
MNHNVYRRLAPTCPHCSHELDADEMNSAFRSSGDLWALAVEEGSTTVKCPLCDAEYWVKGGYVPHYTSAFSEEELEFES